MIGFKRMRMRVDICYVTKPSGSGWRWEEFIENPDNNVFKWKPVREGYFTNPPAQHANEDTITNLWIANHGQRIIKYEFTIDRDVSEEHYECRV